MSNIYFMCDNCGIETNGFTFVNGMKFCAKCYHQIFGKDNQQAEITQLKQQLEKKDKEIEKLKNLFKLNNEVVINQGKEIFDLRVKVLQQKQNQTQLAIQELEKVKTLIQNAVNYEGYTFVEIYDAVNKQIKELKGEKDVED